MKRKTVVIYTCKFDPHVDYIIPEIEKKGFSVFRLNSDEIPHSISVEFSCDKNKTSFTINHISGRSFSTSDVHAVWWRKPSQFSFLGDLSSEELKFATIEWNKLIDGIFIPLECVWVNRPFDVHMANSKIEQLIRAKKFGFSIPKTCITNNPNAVKNFSQLNRFTIFKPLSSPDLGQAGITGSDNLSGSPKKYKMTQTTLIQDLQLQEISKIELAPGIFQEYVEKKLEIRVTVIGKKVFAASIDSQSSEETRIDWRNPSHNANIRWKKFDLPVEIEEKCLMFSESYGLNFSTMDIILDKTGDYVFLENNPNGQFLFMEIDDPSLKMRDAMAEILTNS
jgi:hypothetical protein